ncbi:MAG: twin-arginine translocase TatA/TatE family subunit [Chloroflexi bacterium]|nr:twin-arginine translocase TatA/TatE family subunit [Chloroflexota bacterium]
MPRIGPTELIVILVIILIIFGAGRLPEIGGAIGRGIRNFKRSSSGEEDKEEKGNAAPETPSQTQKPSQPSH